MDANKPQHPPLINILQEPEVDWKPPNPAIGEEDPYIPEPINEEHYAPLILEAASNCPKEAIVELGVPLEMRPQFNRLWYVVRSSPKLYEPDHASDQEGASEAA